MRAVAAFRSSLPLLPLLLQLLLLSSPSLVGAQMSRSIPRTPRNEQFFALSQALFERGDMDQSSCGAQRPDIEQCIKRCNSPGLQERDGCCCIIDNATFFIGVRGGCRYNQRIQNFTQSFIYKSTPINSDKPYFDRFTCAFTDENANADSCTCTLQWEASPDTLQLTSPIPSPSSSPSPVLSPPMSIPPIKTPEPMDTPTVEPTVQPTTVPTIVTPPTAIATASPSPSEPAPTEPELTPFADADAAEPSPSPDGDDDDDDGSVCVAHSYLTERRFGAQQLVHGGDGVMSAVLCPQHADLPCASAHHKVRYHGRDLSYRQLCEYVRCVPDRMLVNSVFSHAWREVQHGDVVLTMFDARYAEAPQKALHALMHKLRVVRQRWM